ncbi:hypothetical protein VPNG_03884 [Cytospora leucostoma]|uniref:NCT transcriptional regulatory complex subunit A n=1 Tax=Cytospora leucostoma TaxID=1230097 RepID=A0A423XEC2_9PEZI|nr:hypothetical protein VPNG_03884 [Cytospora leucostoma]
MSEERGTYRLRSPDLSSFFEPQENTPPAQQAQAQNPQQALSQQQPEPSSNLRPQQQALEAQPYVNSGEPYQQRQIKPKIPLEVDTKDIPEDPNMPPRRAPAAAAESPAVDPSPVKTKFPTARIKRIMQADEEVGKVAQQTPIAVGKALEMFMIQLVTKSADVAREKNSKRVTAAMLKTVVEADDQWDFLRDIVSKVEHEKEGSKAKAIKAESSDTEDDAEPKKRKGGRRKKAA